MFDKNSTVSIRKRFITIIMILYYISWDLLLAVKQFPLSLQMRRSYIDSEKKKTV